MEILLVEDSPGDVRLTLEVFRDTNPSVGLHVAEDGTEAMSFLRREGSHASAPRPDLILLDLNMPKMNGHEALAEIKGDPHLRRIPVVALTTSKAEEDIVRSYDLGVNSFISKPVTFEGLAAVTQTLADYWFELVKLPERDGDGDR